MAWHTSTRRGRLPPNWPALRAATRDRARGRCEADTHHPRCDGWGTDADHHTPGDDHSLENLRWLNAWCHRDKTAQETATRNQARGTTRHRPEGRHPGALG